MICTYWLSGRAGREIFGSRINVRTEHSEIRALWSWAIQFPFQPELAQSRNFLSHDYPSFFNFFSSSARISRGLAAFSISCGPQTGIFILKFSIKARGVIQVIRWLKLWYLNTFGRNKYRLTVAFVFQARVLTNARSVLEHLFVLQTFKDIWEITPVKSRTNVKSARGHLHAPRT